MLKSELNYRIIFKLNLQHFQLPLLDKYSDENLDFLVLSKQLQIFLHLTQHNTSKTQVKYDLCLLSEVLLAFILPTKMKLLVKIEHKNSNHQCRDH